MRRLLSATVRRVERLAEPHLRRLERWMMAGRRPRRRALMVLAAPVTAGVALLAVANGTGDPAGWALVGLGCAYVLAAVLADARARARRRQEPVCSCRRGQLGRALPPGRAVAARMLAGAGALGVAYAGLELSTAWAVAWTWVGVSHIVAARGGYPGRPEVGAVAAALLDRPVATGCGPWCVIDGKLLGVERQRPGRKR